MPLPEVVTDPVDEAGAAPCGLTPAMDCVATANGLPLVCGIPNEESDDKSKVLFPLEAVDGAAKGSEVYPLAIVPTVW